MAIQLVGTVTHGSRRLASNPVISLTSLTGGIGSAPIENDIVVVAQTIGSQYGDGIAIISSGYTTVANLNSVDTFQSNFLVSVKRMSATPDTSVTIKNQGGSSTSQTTVVYVLRGVHISDTFSVKSTATGLNTSAPTPPAITPTDSGSVILCIGGAVAGFSFGGAVYTASQLTSFTQVFQSSSYNAITGTGYYSWVSGTFTPAAWTVTKDDPGFAWCSLSLSFKPAPAVGPANLKSYNTNLKANIKSIDTNLIANVKSFDTNV